MSKNGEVVDGCAKYDCVYAGWQSCLKQHRATLVLEMTQQEAVMICTGKAIGAQKHCWQSKDGGRKKEDTYVWGKSVVPYELPLPTGTKLTFEKVDGKKSEVVKFALERANKE